MMNMLRSSTADKTRMLNQNQLTVDKKRMNLRSPSCPESKSGKDEEECKFNQCDTKISMKKTKTVRVQMADLAGL